MLSYGKSPHLSRMGIDWEAHLEALPMATWIGDPKGGNVFVNLAYRSLLGVVNSQIVSDRGWAKYIHPDDRASYLKAWDDFVEGRATRFQQTVRWIRPDTGHTVKLAVRAQKLNCGYFQGWIRSNAAEQALATLERLTHVHL